MRKTTFMIDPKCSVSLSAIVARKERNMGFSSAARAAGFEPTDPNIIQETDLVPVILSATDADALLDQLPDLTDTESVESITKNVSYAGVAGSRRSSLASLASGTPAILSAHVGANTLAALMTNPQVERMQTKKESKLHLPTALPDIRLLLAATGERAVPETGREVMIGVVDSGFDLSHPMFRDAQGRLRVDGLLDQTSGNRAYSHAELERGWANGRRGPGADNNGHGTHVATIAGGSRFQDIEGVAPEARFLLVKTNFRDTDSAVFWIFQKAGTRACVVNLSLGHHFGAHDGTDLEERFHRQITGPGKIIVVSAGNERTDNLHVGSRFAPGQVQEVQFDVGRQQNRAPFLALTFWYSQLDQFEFSLLTPSGQTLPFPAINSTDNYQSSGLDIEVSLRPYAWSNSIQAQVALSFKSVNARDRDLRGWRIRMRCVTAVIGRLDGWLHNSGFGSFRDHSMIERARTIGLAATGDGCIAVASHVTQTRWTGDLGVAEDTRAVLERSSDFSSQGPTRDGRWKPDISAPGQYLTAALADGSEMADWDERASVQQRLLTIEGTSMAAPMVSGAIALLLQRKPNLTVEQIRTLMGKTARRDAHTGPGQWNPSYGFGKIDVAEAVNQIDSV